ncbi:MAG: hypothetical protein KF895_16320, partial [Parvibaculum sp.]|nr:hypothetical protein [Parvibaculum sp.]
ARACCEGGREYYSEPLATADKTKAFRVRQFAAEPLILQMRGIYCAPNWGLVGDDLSSGLRARANDAAALARASRTGTM